MKFVHKKTQRIVDLPAHFATAKVAKNFEPLVDEVEEEKVVIENSPNSQTRSGKKVKDSEPSTIFTFPASDEDEN